MNIKERLIKVAKDRLQEDLDSSKNMISDNIVPAFDDMGMANVKPGEFASDEITDQENLVNTANMSNDNDFNADSNSGNVNAEIPNSGISTDEVNISEPKADAAASIEIVKTIDKEHDCENPLAKFFSESRISKAVEKALAGKSCEQFLKEASDFAGPRDFVPDLRLNVSEVLNTLKDEIGEGSEGIHVDQVYDNDKRNAYKVSQIDKEKLPKNLHVQNVMLKLDGDTYKLDKPAEDYPLAK